jgi:hypothetical protein
METNQVNEKHCYYCEADLDDTERKWELVDGRGYLYGMSCEECAEGAFDRYMESRIG